MDKPRDLDRLWLEFKQKNSIEARNEILLHYTPLVKNIVMRMMPTYRRHLEFDDLTSYGIMGLIDAIEKFDITKGVKFETYASLRIKGEIVDQIRKQDWAPISFRQKIKKVEDAYAAIEMEQGRPGTEQDVAKRLDMSLEDVRKTMEESHTFNLLSFDDLVTDRLKGEQYLHGGDSPDERLENDELKEMLASFIDDLPEKEKLVISLYYYDELTLKEIGMVLGVSESRVSQIHSKSLMTLRSKMISALK